MDILDHMGDKGYGVTGTLRQKCTIWNPSAQQEASQQGRATEKDSLKK
jgi:hypothetical protein